MYPVYIYIYIYRISLFTVVDFKLSFYMVYLQFLHKATELKKFLLGIYYESFDTEIWRIPRNFQRSTNDVNKVLFVKFQR